METSTLYCCREQYLFNVFEVIVSTLESKLQRIENLDKAVEHLMRRVEALDSRVNDNIDKTDAVITKLRTLDLKLFNTYPVMSTEAIRAAKANENGSGSHTEDSKQIMSINSAIFYHYLIDLRFVSMRRSEASYFQETN